MKKILNKVTCIFVSLTFLMGCMATPAFAYSGGETDEKTTVTSPRPLLTAAVKLMRKPL